MIGQTLSNFQITAKLGEGGMGEVYRATDSRLKRDVALKVLPAEMASRPQLLERFQREAEAIAALNHPNIVTIHSVEEVDGVHFLTMELVDGESLDRTLHQNAMPLPRSLEITAAIADALSAAHEGGIVHRDLKPGNVMLTASGHVKVLDFGLAKLTRDRSPEVVGGATEMPTEVRPLTKEGVVMGTAPYMAPEQALGQPVDFRSDIFSLGCILYEAATGSRPFSGKSTIDILRKVVHDEPEPLSQRLPTAPMQLQWILRKALAKDPDRRYQSASDMAVDLRQTRVDLDSDAQIATVGSMRTYGPVRASSRRPWQIAVAGAGLLVGALLVWYFASRALDSGLQAAPPTMSIRPITSSGVVTAAAISPDGKYIGYVEAYQGEQSLHLRQLGSAQSLELIPRAPVGYWSLTFTPDSDEIVYGLKDDRDYLGAMYRISALGGAPRKLIEHMDSPPTFSPDGSRFAWLRADFPENAQSALMVADADGSNERVLVAMSPPDALAPRYYTAPSWSPDGRVIAASVASTETANGRIEAYDAETGERVWTSERRWALVSRVDWLPGGDALLAVATPEAGYNRQIWLVPYPKGVPRQITDDLYWYRIASPSADGRAIVAVRSVFESTMWSSRVDGSGHPVRISSTLMDGLAGFDFLADGRLVYQTVEEGRWELAIMNADGTGRQLLTDDLRGELFPTATPDGRILYTDGYPDEGRSQLRLMDLEGNDSPPLAEIEAESYVRAALSPDGSRAVISRQSGLWRVPLDGSTPTQLTDFYALLPAVSPDGSRVAFYIAESDQPLRIGILSIETGALEERPVPASISNSSSLLRWADDEALVLNSMPGDRSNLWRVPLDGSEPKRLTDFTDEYLYWFEYSPDGETLVVSKGKYVRDAVLITDFR